MCRLGGGALSAGPGVERQQLKWFAAGAGQLALLFTVATVFQGLWDRWVPLVVSDLVFGISFAMIPSGHRDRHLALSVV